MATLWKRSAANGLQREWLNAEQLQEREPNIVGLGGILVPASSIVDYRQVTVTMAEIFTRRGGEIIYQAEVTALHEERQSVAITTARSEFSSRYLIACSGLMADRLVAKLGIDAGFIICPFRGEYFRLASQHNQIVNHLIYPVPDPAVPFLGVHLTRTIEGSVTVGPNAVLAMQREGYHKLDFSWRDVRQMAGYPGMRKMLRRHFQAGVQEMKNSLYKSGYLRLVQRYCPTLQQQDLLPHPAGVRAQAVTREGELIDDFLFVSTARTLHVCNAPSPAATSALPIGEHIVSRIKALVG